MFPPFDPEFDSDDGLIGDDLTIEDGLHLTKFTLLGVEDVLVKAELSENSSKYA